MEISDILKYANFGTLFGILVAVLVISYLLFALFTWNFIKPCKYIGVSSIVVGCLLLVIRFANSFVLDLVVPDISIPNSVLSTVFKPLLIMGIIYIFVGIALIVLQHLYFKKKNTNINKGKKKVSKK